MLYSILIYGTDADIANLSKAEEERLIGQHIVVQGKLAAERKLGPVVRLSVCRDEGTAARLLRRRLRHAGRSAGSGAPDRHCVHVTRARSAADLVVSAQRQHRSFEEQGVVGLKPDGAALDHPGRLLRRLGNRLVDVRVGLQIELASRSIEGRSEAPE
jgi:hypothetical protein